MAKITRLTLFAPGFAGRVREDGHSGVAPALEQLAGRGRFERMQRAAAEFEVFSDWQRTVLEHLAIDPASVASAPVSAVGAGVANAAGTWLLVDFVHLAAGLDHLVLVPLAGAHTLDPAHRMQLAEALAPDFASAKFEWIRSGASDFLCYADALDAQTCAMDMAVRLPLTQAMPRGSAGRQLRLLMTEAQMRLHEHPVNLARSARGQLAANAVWLWGSGETHTIRATRPLPAIHADDVFVRGLCHFLQHACESLPLNLNALLARTTVADEVLVVLPDTDIAQLEENWFAPLQSAIASGAVGTAHLRLDDAAINVDRTSRLRFWRRALPLDQWYRA